MGFCLPAGAVRALILFQLLVSFSIPDHHPFLDAGQLSRTISGERLFSNSVSFYVDRRPGDALFIATGLSTSVLPFIPRRSKKGSVLPACDHSLVGKLSGSCLCLENDPG